MTQKIKLMSDEDINSLVKQIYDKNPDNHFVLQHTHVVHQTIVDECEKRAMEKLKEVAFKAWCDSCDLYDLSVNPNCPQDFEAWFQQFLKEQDGE